MKALVEGGLLARAAGDLERSARLTEQANALACAEGDQYLVARIAGWVARTALAQGRYAVVIQLSNAVRSMTREANYFWYPWLLLTLAEAQLRQGDLDGRCRRCKRRWMRRWHATRAWGIAGLKLTEGHLRRMKQELARAESLYSESLAFFVGYPYRAAVLDALAGLAAVAAAQGDTEPRRPAVGRRDGRAGGGAART